MVGIEPDGPNIVSEIPKVERPSVSFPKRKSFQTILGAILVLVLVVGGVAGYWLTQQSQDVRQQAQVVSKPNPPIVESPINQGVSSCYLGMPQVIVRLNHESETPFSAYRVWARILDGGDVSATDPDRVKLFTSDWNCNSNAWPYRDTLSNIYTIPAWDAGSGSGCSNETIKVINPNLENGDYTLRVLVAGYDGSNWIESDPTTVFIRINAADNSCINPGISLPNTSPTLPEATPTAALPDTISTVAPTPTHIADQIPNTPLVTGLTPGGCYASLPEVFVGLDLQDNNEFSAYRVWARILGGSDVSATDATRLKLFTSGWECNTGAWPNANSFNQTYGLTRWQTGAGDDASSCDVTPNLPDGEYTFRTLVAGSVGGSWIQSNPKTVSFSIDSQNCGSDPVVVPWSYTEPIFEATGDCQPDNSIIISWNHPASIAQADSYKLSRKVDIGEWLDDYKTNISQGPQDITSVSDQIESGHSYTYVVKALDSGGDEIGYSNVVAANCSTYSIINSFKATAECTSKRDVSISWAEMADTLYYTVSKKVGSGAWTWDYKMSISPEIRNVTDQIDSGTTSYYVNAIRPWGGQAVYNSNLLSINCDSWTPGPTIPPVEGTFIPMCLAISKDIASPQYGDILTLTCSVNENEFNPTDYVFRYKFVNYLPSGAIDNPNSGGPFMLEKIIGAAKQATLHIEHTGTYTVECRACTGGTCPAWED